MNRLNLKDWSRLDDIRQKINTEAEAGRWQIVPNLIIESIILCGAEIEDPPWMDVAELYVEAVTLNQPRIKFPIFTSKEKGKKMPWEYEGRTWYFWLNLFAGQYGWAAQDIGELDLDDAFGLYEEIVVDDQHEKEWEYGLSEMAYVYNTTTKKSHFRPLSKPDWMLLSPDQAKKSVKKIRMPKSALPVGEIINLTPDEI